ncbi:gfo/Idh/MocA family oxidoreductase [bacterium]|nr:MAG: gfo/Idh/MocA family oxidoreductase [bacterium]
MTNEHKPEENEEPLETPAGEEMPAEDEGVIITPRREFLRAMGLVGAAGLILPRWMSEAQAAPTGKPATPKSPLGTTNATKKAGNTTPATKNQAVTKEVKDATKPQAAPTKPAVKVEEVKVAIIGAGSQGRNLLLNALKIPGIRFVAVCDIWPYSQDYSVNILKKYGQTPKAYTDYQDMLEKEPSIQAVIIATPDWQHAPQTVDCLKAGKHVYCEKEMSNTLEGARSMVLAARESGKLLQIGHQRRSNPRYWHSYELINGPEKVLGRVTHTYGQWNRQSRLEIGWPKNRELSADVLKRYGYDTMERFRNWRWYRQYSGGAIADLGSHQIDIFSWFLQSNPVSVMAAGGNDYYKVGEWYDHVMAIYEFNTGPGKVRGIYQVLNTTGWGGYYEVFMGDQGVLEVSEDTKKGFIVRNPGAPPKKWEDDAEKINAMGVDAIALKVGETLKASGRPKEERLQEMSEKAPHQLHLENFFSAIRNGTKLSCPPEVGYETCVAVLKANDAVAAERKLTFDPSEFKV